MAKMPCLLGIFLLAGMAEAARISTEGAAHAARSAVSAGQVLRGRYQLKELLHRGQSGGRRGNSSAVRVRSQRWNLPKWLKRRIWPQPRIERPSEPPQVGTFPWGEGKLNKKRFPSAEELGLGTFGETWKAYDKERQAHVAIKIFYHGTAYLKPGLNAPLTNLLEEGEAECTLVQKMVAGKSTYPEGKDHICTCLESHVFDNLGEDDVSFLVLELCGTTLAKKIFEQKAHPSPEFITNIRHWMKGSLMAVRFMSGLETPMTHGDLHAGNIVINDANEAKFIDFGLTMPSEAAAPEAPPWLSDVAMVAALYGKLLCGEPRFKRIPPSCWDGNYGLGTEEDWAVVNAAVNGGDDTGSPESLMSLLPE